MPTIHDQIRARTDVFVNDIANLVRGAALEAITAALGASKAPARALPSPKKAAPAKAAPAKKAPAAKKAARGKAAPAKAPAAPKRAAKKGAAKRPLGAKRPPAELAALVEKLGSYIKSNPGQGVESIGKALSIPTKELTLPLKKLLGAKRIRFEGQKRATKYFPS